MDTLLRYIQVKAFGRGGVLGLSTTLAAAFKCRPVAKADDPS